MPRGSRSFRTRRSGRSPWCPCSPGTGRGHLDLRLLVLVACSSIAVVACRRDAGRGGAVVERSEGVAPWSPASSGVAAATEPGTPVLDKFRQPDRLIAALGLRAGDGVAEVGAGSGYLSLRLARAVGPSGRVTSTDIDGALLGALEARARVAGLSQISTRLVPSGDPKLEAGAYDLILLAQVDHLLPDRAAYLRALLPALKPGGRIAISNRDRWKSGLLDAIQPLPLSLVEDPLQLPAQFLVFLVPAPGR